MNQEKQRQSERLSIPIRVIGVSPETGEFTEDSHTVVVDQAGARIVLKQRVAAGEAVRIINLENYNEADFRVVGPTRLPDAQGGEWGVECTEPGRNIWGIELSPSRHVVSADGVLLECRACHQQGMTAATLMEVEVLESTGQITRECVQCAKTTYWTYADATRRPREIPPSEPAAPQSTRVVVKTGSERRVHKRLAMKLPVLVRNQRNEQEITKTENVSKGGVAVSLAMDLAVGDSLTVICPYSPGGQNIEQKAEVRWRSPFPFSGMRTYGLRYTG
jgi:hypothetical protein